VSDALQPDAFEAWLKERWNQGCHNAAKLYRQLRDMGFAGSPSTVRRYVSHWRSDEPLARSSTSMTTPPSDLPQHLSARRVAWLLTKDHASMEKEERMLCRIIRRGCPCLMRVSALARWFARMVRKRQVEQLDTWIDQACKASSSLRGFAQSLQRDRPAVNAALTSAWSNGQVEGQINRLKLIKRQMYGRANFDLLKARFLYAG
jgi:transposase